MKVAYKKRLFKAFSTITTVSLLLASLPNTAFAVATNIRQEINIIDAIVTASGDHSAIIQLDTTKYTGATYYFETVALVSSGTLTVALERVGTATQDATISVTATSFTRQRTVFTPPASAQTEYNINLSGGTGPQVKAARIVVLQSADPITNTQTQIEIGNQETAKNNTSTSAITNPKYWLYDSSKWNGSPTFSAEVTYKDTQVASSTTYAVPGTHTYIVSQGVSYTQVELWGSGGGGRCSTSNAGGGGGGGGAYARSTTTPIGGSSHTVVVSATSTCNTTTSNDSTYDTTTVVADGGAGSGASATGGAGGTTANSTGDVEFAGGLGGNALGTNDTGGGGGGGAGPNGAGGGGSNGPSGATSSGGGGGGGNGGNTASNTATGGSSTNGGAGGNGGASANGSAGTSHINGGGGGGGSGSTTLRGGPGGSPGGGGGGGDTTASGQLANGGRGQAKLVETHGQVGIAIEEDNGSFGGWTNVAQIVTNGTATSSPARVRVSFTPTSGRNYRLVASTTASTASYDIYNAKIIVDQTSPTLLEPQYLIANTGSFGGTTGLKDFDTLFDPAEWVNVTNTYIHEANGAAAGTGGVKLQQDPNGTPADITGSTITGVIEREQSTAMTMPGTSQTLDVNVTGTGTLNASRILVQVAPPPAAPTVATNAATSVTVSSATLNGEITATGGSNATVRGFAWGTSLALSGGDTSTTTESGSFGVGTFSQAVLNLLSNETYYFRAYATNPNGTGYGSIQNFTTGTDTTIKRTMHLFEGFKVKLITGKIILY